MNSLLQSFVRRCRRLSLVATSAAVAYGAIAVLFWLLLPFLDSALFNRLAGIPPGEPTPGFLRLLVAVGISLLFAGPAILFLYSLARVLRACAAEPIFAPDAPHWLRRMAWAAGLYAIGNVVSRSLFSVWATWSMPPGQHSLTVSVGSGDLIALFVASLVALLAWTFDAAAAIEAESRLTV